jgi:dTDP-4-dehydrorhamnose 3,5-epimerase
MKFISTPIEGVYVVNSATFQDKRGAFTRFYCENELDKVVNGRQIKQINFSKTKHIGAVRGLHFQQYPYAEMKMVRCVKGRVWDVVVDLRNKSKTFLQYFAQELSSENALMIIIPEGCAHGFQVLKYDSELLYLHTAPYMPSSESGVRFDDPRLNILWPLPVTNLSERDQMHPLIGQNFSGVRI